MQCNNSAFTCTYIVQDAPTVWPLTALFATYTAKPETSFEEALERKCHVPSYDQKAEVPSIIHSVASCYLLITMRIVKSRDIVLVCNLCSRMITSASVACWSCSLSLSFRIGNDHANTL